MQPKIGIISFVGKSTPKVFEIQSSYVRAIIDNGGMPVLIPVTEHSRWCADYATLFDGLLLPGGEDVHPFSYGEEPLAQVNYMNIEKDEFEIALIHATMAQNKPIMGICRGYQMLNVALGGTLYQDIPTQLPTKLCHVQSMDIRSEAVHRVTLTEGSAIARCIGKTDIAVNSYHHQAVKTVAPSLCAVGHATDGVIEATETPDGKVFAVEWHPEHLYLRYPEFAGLFRRLVELSSH